MLFAVSSFNSFIRRYIHVVLLFLSGLGCKYIGVNTIFLIVLRHILTNSHGLPTVKKVNTSAVTDLSTNKMATNFFCEQLHLSCIHIGVHVLLSLFLL